MDVFFFEAQLLKLNVSHFGHVIWAVGLVEREVVLTKREIQ